MNYPKGLNAMSQFSKVTLLYELCSYSIIYEIKMYPQLIKKKKPRKPEKSTDSLLTWNSKHLDVSPFLCWMLTRSKAKRFLSIQCESYKKKLKRLPGPCSLLLRFLRHDCRASRQEQVPHWQSSMNSVNLMTIIYNGQHAHIFKEYLHHIVAEQSMERWIIENSGNIEKPECRRRPMLRDALI